MDNTPLLFLEISADRMNLFLSVVQYKISIQRIFLEMKSWRLISRNCLDLVLFPLPPESLNLDPIIKIKAQSNQFISNRIKNIFNSDINQLFTQMISKQFIKLKQIQSFCRMNMSKKKNKDDDSSGKVLSFQRETVEIQEKYRVKSAALYDHFAKLRDRPMLTLDNYQISYALILERMPIFIPYKEKHFQYIKAKYEYEKKAKKNIEIPKELQIERGQFLFTEFQRINQENVVSHRNQVSKTEVYEYAENSRYWRYSDPDIQDPKCSHTYSSDNVFFIVKDKKGEWRFPSRILTERDNHQEFFTLLSEEIFGGANSPLNYFSAKKPIYVRRIVDQTLDRGEGIQQMFFKGISVTGIPKFPTTHFEDYAWVPKAHLSDYFKEDYFNQIAKLTIHAY